MLPQSKLASSRLENLSDETKARRAYPKRSVETVDRMWCSTSRQTHDPVLSVELGELTGDLLGAIGRGIVNDNHLKGELAARGSDASAGLSG